MCRCRLLLGEFPTGDRCDAVRSSLSLFSEGGALYDPAADKAFVDALRKYLDRGIKIIEVNTDINNSQFARVVVECLKESLKSRRPLR